MDKAALILVIIGALNWLSVGILGFDAVAFLFGGQNALLSRIVYTLVGVAGLVSIGTLVRWIRDDDERSVYAESEA